MKLAICIPSGDMIHADFSMSLLGMQNFFLQRPPVREFRYNIYNERGSLIQLSRHKLVERALGEECTHLLFLDSDMTFPRDTLHRLLQHNLPIVGCNYVKRVIPATSNTVATDGKMLMTTDDKHGLEPAASAGFGVLLLKTEVCKAIEPPWFDCVWLEDGRLIGEDVFFFRKAARAGYTLMIDHDVSREVGHVGSFEYTNNLCAATFSELNAPMENVR